MNQSQKQIVKHTLFQLPPSSIPCSSFLSPPPHPAEGLALSPPSGSGPRFKMAGGLTVDAPPLSPKQEILIFSGAFWKPSLNLDSRKMALMVVILVTRAYIKSQDVGICCLTHVWNQLQESEGGPRLEISFSLCLLSVFLSFHLQKRPSP